jgi:hypothetical protein
MRDLARVQAVIVDLDGVRYPLRTGCVGRTAKTFQAAGVAIPAAVPRSDPSPASRHHRTPAARAV